MSSLSFLNFAFASAGVLYWGTWILGKTRASRWREFASSGTIMLLLGLAYLFSFVFTGFADVSSWITNLSLVSAGISYLWIRNSLIRGRASRWWLLVPFLLATHLLWFTLIASPCGYGRGKDCRCHGLEIRQLGGWKCVGTVEEPYGEK